MAFKQLEVDVLIAGGGLVGGTLAVGAAGCMCMCMHMRMRMHMHMQSSEEKVNQQLYGRKGVFRG